MSSGCEHQIRETRRGAGPCEIKAEVKLRNGKPNWWCHTHGMAASAPDGNSLKECPGMWFDPVPEDECLELDLASGEVAVWGVIPPGIRIGHFVDEPGKVHVHRRSQAGADKDIDRSFSIVTLRYGSEQLSIEGMAAVAYSVSELSGRDVTSLNCSHCGETLIDELKFATRPHEKHLCNSCGRHFRDWKASISNPLADAHKQLGLAQPLRPRHAQRALEISSSDYAGIALWPSNRAIVSTMSRPEEEGVHVHAWSREDGELNIDETYSPVVIDGVLIDEAQLRLLGVQRALAHNVAVVAVKYRACSADLTTSTSDWIEPVTKQACNECGAITTTRRRVFVNPLAGHFPDR